MNINNKVLFFYQGGRQEKLLSKQNFAQEMFYGYEYFKTNGYKVKAIEFSIQKSKINRIYFTLIEKKLRNILNLPIYWSFLTSLKNLRELQNSNYAIFSNNRVGFSAILIVIISKLTKKRPKSLTFVMGLFSRDPKLKILKPIQKFFIFLFILIFDKFIFLSQGEYEFACKKYKKFQNKFYYLPFAVDLQIWKIKKNIIKKPQILFVGNDGYRDYDFAIQLANNFKKFNFVFLTKNIDGSKLSDNSILYDGSWSENYLSDIELAKLYNESTLTIVPLKDSLQPSGQSVTLQSIACGTPVLITRTKGFWDEFSFKNYENIIFMEDNKINLWSNAIKKLMDDKLLYKNIIESGYKTVNQNYNLEVFNKKVEEILLK